MGSGDRSRKAVIGNGVGRRAARGRPLLFGAVALSFVVAGPAGAQDRPAVPEAGDQSAQAGPAQAQRFEIPAGDLQAALLAFSRQVDLQLLYPTELTAGLRTAGIRGDYSPEQALDTLLAGTGLTYRYTTANTIALSRPAGTGEAGPVTLGAITVTGERAVRSLRDTASSVAVFDTEAIETRPGLDTANDVMERVPNVTTTGTNNFAPTVRGVDGTGPAQGADAFFAGTRPRLNVQVDGRPLSFNEVIFGEVSLWDVEQVEMLRGPQSTLQGRNSIAGTTVVRTKDPTHDSEAGGRVIAGNNKTRQGSAFVSGPVVADEMAFRLAVDRRTSESFTHMTPYGEVDPEEFETTTVRAKLLIEPKALEELSAKITFNHTEHMGPQTEYVVRPFEDHVSSSPNMPVFNPRSTSGTVDATWALSDGLALEGTASLNDLSVKRYAPAGQGNVDLDGREIFAEPRLRFEGADGRLNGVGGLYLYRASQDEFIDFPTPGTFDDHTTTLAAFGEGTYAVLDAVDVTLGGRVEQEYRRRSGGAGPFTIDLDERYSAFLPKLGTAWHATEALTVGAVVSRGYNGGGAGFTYNPPFESYTYDPEYVWNYETYARADLLCGRLSLNGNLFYSDYTDMQLPFDLNPDPAVWSVVIRNADRAVTYGAEVGARWLAMPGLELRGDVGLLKTEITEFPGSNVEGNELAQAPAFTASIGGTYTHDSGIEFSADARFSDAYYSSVSNDPRGKTDPYVVVDAKLGYRLPGDLEALHVFGFVNNVFDTQKPINLEPGATAAADVANIVPPRTVGLGLEMSF